MERWSGAAATLCKSQPLACIMEKSAQRSAFQASAKMWKINKR
jgi:hypothetical protein